MITSAQIRAARAMLDWSRDMLSTEAGVGISALMRLESADGVPSGNIKTFEAVQKAFENAGIEFIGTPESGAGVRWKT
ncbi:helix-turn-helix domain-containing protein [Polynucleobacter sp. MWH-UH19D]|uniref:helix-turn-helix transcriptional regulator n=1 Tax=Polynucleobacter sp. MWH-UH19D TaxID=1855610 RepID=UPI00336523C4